MRHCAMVLILVCGALTACSPASARTLVSYERSGGFAGFHDTVTVSSGGSVKVRGRSGSHRSELSDKRLKALRRAVKAARFGSLRKRYGPPYVVNDGITETVRHAGRTVTVDTGGDPPKRLRTLLNRLADLL